VTLAITFRRAARADVDAAVDWYEDRQAGLAQRFLTEVDRCLAIAAEHPLRFAVKHRNIRCTPVRRFPYLIYFVAEQNRIVVLAVFHVRRDPLTWQGRR
jgi:plasmid stabilization system protein ParE